MTANIKIFTGNSNRKLADQIASCLDTKVAAADVIKFANKETSVTIRDSVRDEDVYVLQSGCGDVSVNDSCMELFILASACKTASARRVVGVLPYFPYSKQSKQKKRGSIPAKLVAQMLKVAGVTQVMTLDLHHMQMQGFFDVPIDNIKASPLLIAYIKSEIPKYQDAVIVSKNAGASKRAAVIAKRLRLDFAIIFGEQTQFAEILSEERLATDGTLDAAAAEETVMSATASTPVRNGDGSTRTVSNGMPGILEEESYGDSVIGNVDGRICIIVDDLIDGAHSFVNAAKVLKLKGADKIYLVATHGILSGDAPEVFQGSIIDEIAVTNTIPQAEHAKRCSKLRTIDCSAVLAEGIRRIHFNESVGALYTKG